MRNLLATIRTAAKTIASDPVPLRRTAAIVGVLVVAGIAARADAAPNISYNPASEQRAQAQDICETVVRVQPDDKHFNACVSSLEGSLESAGRERAVLHARGECFARGLKPGSSGLALCLLQAANAAPGSDAMNTPAQASWLIDTGEDSTSPGSDFSASFDTVLRREQRACARLGFDPAFGAFANCVADLQGALQRTDFPSD